MRSRRECSTQAEADAAAAAGDVIVWRAGELSAYGSANVSAYDSARVTDGKTSAPLTRSRPRVVIGPLGSRNDTLGVSLPDDGSDPIVYAGCWSGTLTEFAARVESVYPSGRYGDEYRAATAFVRAMHAIKEE